MEPQRKTSPPPPPSEGYVTRTYPIVLDRWQSLNDVARSAARHVFSALSPGDLFEMQHRQFIEFLPAKAESSSRRAFDLLVRVGLLYVARKGKGRYGTTTYVLLDANDAYVRNGTQLAAESPQMLLPFAIEDAHRADLGGGIIRLFDPNATAIDEAVSDAQCAPSGALNEIQCAARGALSEIQCAPGGALNSSGTASVEDSQKTFHGNNQDHTSVFGESPPEADRRDGDSLQSSTRQGIESGLPLTPGGDAERQSGAVATGGLEAASCPPPPSGDESGTPDATRAPALRAPVGCNSLRQEISTPSIPTNDNQSTNSPFEAPVHPPSALAGDDDSIPADDVDSMIDQLQAIDEAKVTRIAKRIMHAVAIRENALKIPSVRRMRSSAAFRWGRVVADVGVDVTEGHVTELIYDLESIDDLKNPGGLVMSRLMELYRRATGKSLPRRSSK